MGASNGSQSAGNKSYYTLQEKKQEGAQNTGKIRFYKSVKKENKWELGEGFTQMSGILDRIEMQQGEWQGKPKFSVIFNMTDRQTGEKMVVKTSFPTTVSKNILNALSSVQHFGDEISFEVGEPQAYMGKMYPSIFVKSKGQTCKWEFTKTKGNQPPKVETVRDEEGNEIKKGVLAEREFWVKQIDKINAQIEKTNPTANSAATPAYTQPYPSATITPPQHVEDDGDVPF